MLSAIRTAGLEFPMLSIWVPSINWWIHHKTIADGSDIKQFEEF